MIRNNIYKIPLTLLLLIFLGATNAWGQTEISSLSDITDANGSYTLASNFSTTGTPANGIGSSGNPFKGIIDGGLVPITGKWNKPLFDYVEDATIKNVIIQEVSVSTSANAGAIAANAAGATRIYNCGILGGTVSGSDNVGGLVGFLDGTSRVINCYSYATITGGNNVGGIVGNNGGTTTAASINTMVMNCMFYGDITSGSAVSPVYGGKNINNLQGGLNTFNYYAYDKLKTAEITEGKYNCALAVEEKYLTRFEFYRQLLNSNKKLAAFYITGNASDEDLLAKWVLETADRTIDNPKPYPILKAQGYYPSIINPDIEHAPDSAFVGRNKGGKLGKTLSVTISNTKTDGGQSWPTGASITKGSLTLQRTDKDAERYNFNYDKVQLPYYNDVGEGNYTGNRVVTGWKITAITAIEDDPYTSANYPTTGITDYPNHNYADRKSSKKDLYSVSKRVFSQGAYFDVPYGVTSITIEPYWGKACYIADPNYDVVYKNDYSGKQNVTQTGTQVKVGTTLFDGQRIETSVANALNYIKNSLGGLGTTVYDNAVVLVGNLHLDGVPSGGGDPFTMMSVDKDNDHEPDYSLIYHHKGRTAIAPIRFDFLNIPGTAQAQKPNTASLICNFTIFKTKGWFETTNTAFFYTSQLEYENLNGITKVDAPLILHGGVIDQFVSTQRDAVNGNTIYIHLGGNLWMHEFSMGTHSDGSKSTPHVPVSVTGGDYESFYLTGTYNPGAAVRDDNAECYISGGRFGEVAGAGQEQIGNNTTSNGNVHWQIYNADITNFFGGGINDAKPVKGNITTNIFNSYVDVFCGGPKFGNMATEKTVTTNAEGCTFRKYFGAGYGGNSYSRKKYFDYTSYNWSTLQGYYTTDRGKYFNGSSTKSRSGGASDGDYGYKGPGVATDFDYEFFVWSSGSTGARLFVHFVSFSLAQCNDVSSTLKGCTITENFYGGGNLGKVTGTATSVLENCKVTGSVYGGGYSATLPTIPVRDGGFTKAPNFNKSSGMFEPGIYTGTTDYTWKQVASFPSEGGAGFDGTQVITTQNLSNDNLGSVKSSSLTIKGTTVVEGSVYGGGALASMDTSGETKVNLIGGTINGDVYGGGQGRLAGTKDENNHDLPEVAALVGNASVNLNGLDYTTDETTQALYTSWGLVKDETVTGTPYVVPDNAKGCIVKGNIFGCNNLNGTPKGAAKVHIYATQNAAATTIANPTEGEQTAKVADRYDVKAVYGGGNLAAYEPTDLVNGKTNVIIDGCDRTSIKQVYGGGNAASAPATNVTVNGTYEIEELFGGGNGKDDIVVNGVTKPNPGANVGFYAYADDADNAQTPEDRAANYGYGTGQASVNVYGGTIHRVFGGSNTKGNVRKTAVTLLDEQSGCEFCVDEAYGGGKSAPMDAEARLLLACIPGLTAAYGGAEAAAIQGNVTLNITNGTFDRVFGGNNLSGTINGSITVNIEEIGCKPVKIGELYGGGNEAGYSVYGYNDDGTPKPSGTKLYNDPQINVKSFTSIGNIYGGGYGAGATMVGNPTVNVNVAYGRYYNDDASVVGENATTNKGYPLPSHAKGKIGGIYNVFGGGNAARVVGNTTVNVGNLKELFVIKDPKDITVGTTPVSEYYTRNSDGTYTKATGTAEENITYYEKVDVQGVDIRENVYGGGNKAEVTGNTNVQIGQKVEPEPAP